MDICEGGTTASCSPIQSLRRRLQLCGDPRLPSVRADVDSHHRAATAGQSVSLNGYVFIIRRHRRTVRRGEDCRVYRELLYCRRLFAIKEGGEGACCVSGKQTNAHHFLFLFLCAFFAGFFLGLTWIALSGRHTVQRAHDTRSLKFGAAASTRRTKCSPRLKTSVHGRQPRNHGIKAPSVHIRMRMLLCAHSISQ